MHRWKGDLMIDIGPNLKDLLSAFISLLMFAFVAWLVLRD